MALRLYAIMIFGLFFFLLGCDKGMRSLKSAEESYKTAVDTPLTEENLEEAVKLALLYKMISEAHADKGSGEKAKEKLAQIRERANTRKEELKQTLDQVHEKTVPVLTKYINRVSSLEKKIRNFKAPLSRSKISAGTCIGFIHGSEFDSLEKRATTLNLWKITEVGIEEVMVEKLLAADEKDLLNPNEGLKRMGSSEAVRKFRVDSKYSLPCEQAEEIATLYKEVLETSKPVDGLKTQFQYINTILTGKLL